MKSYLSRRALLRDLGVGIGMLPLLNVSRSHAAGVGAGPKRLLMVIQTGGCIAGSFFPAAGNLTGTLPDTLSPLEPYKKDIIVIDGVRMSNFLDYGDYGAGHENYASVFTGTRGYILKRSDGDRYNGNSPTPDQVVAEALAKTTKLPFKSLPMATQVDDHEDLSFLRRAFWSGPNQAVTPEGDPNKVVGPLFGGKTAGDPASDKLLKAKGTLLDYVGRDLEAFARRVGTEDRMKIQQHLQSYQELQQRLANQSNSPVSAGGACKGVTVAADLGVHDQLKYKQVMGVQFDIIAAAFACDATRVATLQLTNGSGTSVVYPDLKDIGTENTTFKDTAKLGLRNYHDVQHNSGPADRNKITVDRWYMDQFASLILRLKSIPEGAGKSVLDNTVILWANHMGNGGAHSSDRLPWILAGSCGGYFKTGQCLKPGKTNTNNVLVSLVNAMGYPQPSFGDSQYGGELAGLKA